MKTHAIRSRREPYPGYFVVASGFVIQGTIIGAIFTYGVFFDALHVELGWSRAVISAGSSLASVVMGLGAMFFGRLTDSTGPRRILTASAIAISLGYLLMSRMTLPWHLLVVYPLFVGVAFGSHDVVTLSTVTRWFGRRRGRMSAIVKAGTGTGQVIGPAVAAILISALGWRTAYFWLAAVTGPLVFIAGRWMYRSPQEMSVSHEDRQYAVQEGDPPDENRDTTAGVRDLVGRPQFRLLCIAQGAVFFCVPIVIVHLVPYATDLGIERTIAAGVLSVIGGISIAGRLVVGSIVDRVGARRALLFCYTIMLASFVLLQFAGSALMLYLFALIYGFAHGGMFTSVSPLVAELFGTRYHGMLYGTTVFIGTVSGAIGPTAAGAVFDALGTYRPAFLLLIALVVVAIVAMVSIRTER